MTARAALAERERAQVVAARRTAQVGLCLVGRRRVARDAAQVHQVHHGRGRAALRDLVERCRGRARAFAKAAVFRGHRQAQEAVGGERGDGLAGKGPLGVDARRVRRDGLVGDRRDVLDDVLSVRGQTIHWLSPLS